ncbi:MAG: DUF6108 family protein [Clostridiales bacterium]|nr:DUF6108 family protein [Clostridiales bacterium]
MKRLLFIIVLTLTITTTGMSQEGLNIGRFFTEQFLSQPDVTAVTIEGETLKKWECDISLYRSIIVVDNAAIAQEMEKAVKHDGANARERTVSMTSGHIYFGMYVLPPKKRDVNRFIIFMRSRDKNNRDKIDNLRTDLFYIEGKTSPEEFNSMLRSIKKSKNQ